MMNYLTVGDEDYILLEYENHDCYSKTCVRV